MWVMVRMCGDCMFYFGIFFVFKEKFLGCGLGFGGVCGVFGLGCVVYMGVKYVE